MRPLTIALVALVAALGAGARASAQGVVHVERHEGWTREPVTDEHTTARLRAAAVEYRQYAPIPRIAMFNIGYPSSAAEYATLHGYAAIVVTTMAQDSLELPPARLYFRDAAGRETDLPRIAYTCGRLAAGETVIAGTFGVHRCDALHFIPAVVAKTPGDLLVDFAVRRRGFRVGQFTGSAAPAVAQLPLAPAGTVPPLDAARPFLVREFPAFAPLLAAR